MSNSQEKLNENLENFYKLEVPQDIKNILISIWHVKTERQLKERLAKIENHQYGNDLMALFSQFIWKNIKIEHPEIWENKKSWKKIIIDEQWETTEKNNYECSWFVIWTLIEIKFYDNALWSLVLQNPDGWKSLVSMTEINDWLTINELSDKEFNKHKRIVKLKQEVSDNAGKVLAWWYNQY